MRTRTERYFLLKEPLEELTRGEYGNQITGFHLHEECDTPCVMDSDFGCFLYPGLDEYPHFEVKP